jgi:hypothetical protein
VASIAAGAKTPPKHDHDRDYKALLEAMTRSFVCTEPPIGTGAMFVTDAIGLNDIYLDALPAERKIHDCSACRHFLDRFGGLARIDDRGFLVPVFWRLEGVPSFYQDAVTRLAAKVESARIVSPFYTKQTMLGTMTTGRWEHMGTVMFKHRIFDSRTETAGQAMARMRHRFATVAQALNNFTPQVLDQALALLKAGHLARSEKFLAPTQWLRDLHDRPKGRRGENLLWAAVAAAPEGYCHPSGSVLGSLFEDIIEGRSFEAIRAAFAAKLGVTVYQRPQEPPTTGNVAAAEKLVEKMGIAPSLRRRFARIDEVTAIWRPKEASKPTSAGGVFSHLKTRDRDEIEPIQNLPEIMMTWEKFARTVLPEALSLDYLVMSADNFQAITTSVHPDDPPIWKWDRLDERNPFCAYAYERETNPIQWALTAPGWISITAVTAMPWHWGTRLTPGMGPGAILILRGAVDLNDGGAGLFPELLRSELHPVRATIEAFSQTAKIGGREEASACGIGLNGSGKGIFGHRLIRATTALSQQVYRIGRWD